MGQLKAIIERAGAKSVSRNGAGMVKTVSNFRRRKRGGDMARPMTHLGGDQAASRNNVQLTNITIERRTIGKQRSV